MNIGQFKINEIRLGELCQRYRVSRLSLFGSALRGSFKDDSDVDFLVEFLPGSRVSLFDLGGMVMDLRDLVGRDVDLRTPLDLSPKFRDDVIHSAKLLYAA